MLLADLEENLRALADRMQESCERRGLKICVSKAEMGGYKEK